MIILTILLACAKDANPRCSTVGECLTKLDDAVREGRNEDAFVAAADGCSLNDRQLCMRLAEIYLDPASSQHSEVAAMATYASTCNLGHVAACGALGEMYAEADQMKDAAQWFHSACEGKVVEWCTRSASYALKVKKLQIAEIAMPDAIQGCSLDNATCCADAAELAGAIGAPSGQDLAAFQSEMRARACKLGDKASCMIWKMPDEAGFVCSNHSITCGMVSQGLRGALDFRSDAVKRRSQPMNPKSTSRERASARLFAHASAHDC